MIKSAVFATEFKKHLARWDRENPLPPEPTVDKVAKELKGGKFDIDTKELTRALKRPSEWRDTVCFAEVIMSASMTAHAKALEARTAAKASFEEILGEVRNNYLDRVLFDHESGFSLLRDFQRWREQKGDGFDLPSRT